jgi:hypothetical protein
MSDEFDEAIDPVPAPSAARESPGRGRSARLIARLYGSANLALRTRFVACLIRPLSPLGLAAVAAGAFTILLSRRGAGGISIAVADVAQFSKEQIAELARFVEQVSPESLRQVAALVTDNRVAAGTFTASVGMLLALELSGAAATRRRRARAQTAGA